MVDEPVDSYRAGKATYAKRPPPPPPSYSSNSPVLSGGHSLSSLYEPLTFDDLYNSPKATYMSHPPKSPFSSPVKPYGHSPPPPPPPPPSAYMSYGPHVEYSMPPKTLFSTSGSPYGSGGPLGGPKYKGPYRTVNTGPSGFASYGYASSYGKPHYTGYTTSSSSGHPHGNLLASSSSPTDNLLSDMYTWYKTRGSGYAQMPPMMKMTPYYKYKYSTISHSNGHMHPFEYENGTSEMFYKRRRPRRNRLSRFRFRKSRRPLHKPKMIP